jgi:RNA polymerase sigma-70 factor (ECF subfamily)
MLDSDREIVRRVLQGEKDLFGVLVERYERAAYAVAYNLLRNPEDARDLAQEIFVKAYGQLATLKDAGKFSPWLCRIASRLAIDRLRVQKKNVSLPELELPEEAASHNPGTTPADAQEKRDARYRLVRIREMITHLADYYRVAFILKYMEGLTNREIASFLGVPVSTIEGRLHKAREFLREKLDR